MIELSRPDDWENPVTIPPLDGLRRILVPFDGSHSSERALAFADLCAAGLGAEILVMIAYEPPFTKKGRGALYVEDMQAALREEAYELVGEAVALLEERGRTVRGLVVKGEAALAIVDTAEQEDIDVIVMGRRGLSSEMSGLTGSLERLRSSLGGAVTDKVSRSTECVVIAVG